MNSVRPILVQTSDGWFLRGDVTSKGSENRPVVILLHAMMASRKTMDRPRGAGFGSLLAARGFVVVSMDLRGHGESGPNAADGARYSYDDYVLHDIPAVMAFVRNAFPGRRIIVIGHSLGAHTTLAASGVFPDNYPDAVVSIAGNMWTPSCEPDTLRRARKTATLAAFCGFAETWGYFDPRPFRFGTDPVALPYVRQFWKIWSTDHYTSQDGAIDYRESLAKITFPVLSVTSVADSLLAHPVAVEHFLSPIASRYKTLRVVTSNDGNQPAPSHMGLVTNAGSRGVWEGIADWIEQLERRENDSST